MGEEICDLVYKMKWEKRDFVCVVSVERVPEVVMVKGRLK